MRFPGFIVPTRAATGICSGPWISISVTAVRFVSVEATNTATGVVYPGASSSAGNFTLAQLPAGTYDLSVVVPGFKRYVRPGIIVEVAGTVRVDATLEVGAATESVTIPAEAPLLKSESGEISYNVATNTLDDLPILTLTGAPYAFDPTQQLVCRAATAS